MTKKRTNNEIFEAVKGLAQSTDQRCDAIEKHVKYVEAVMITKDYLDERLWHFRGDVMTMINHSIGQHEARSHKLSS